MTQSYTTLMGYLSHKKRTNGNFGKQMLIHKKNLPVREGFIDKPN